MQLTYRQKYIKLLQNSLPLFSVLFFVGILDATNIFFLATVFLLYILYCEFSISVEIPCVRNFKEKAEFIGRTGGKKFGVYVGSEGMDSCITELNLWIHFAVMVFACTVFFVVACTFSIDLILVIALAIFFTVNITIELIELRNFKTAILCYSIIISFIAMTLIDSNVETYEDACLKIALLITMLLCVLCFVVSFVKSFARIL